MDDNSNSTSKYCPFKEGVKGIIMPLSDVKIVSGRYLIPPLFVFGVVGNILNLLVLNSKGMRTKTNALLSAMAFADLCFFFCILPSEVISYDYNRNSHSYMEFFINSRMSLTAMTNFFSTASTWLAVVVTGERVVAIKMPLHAKFYLKRWRIVFIIVFIYCLSLALACYNFFWMKPFKKSYCNGTVYIYGLQLINQTESPNLHTYVQISLLISPFFVVCLPMFLLITLNTSLLYYLHRNRLNMKNTNCTSTPQLRVNEFRVTFMVAVIILSFIILSTPSAVLYFHDWFYTYMWNSKRTSAYIQAATVANLLVITNKAMNFVLYCSASSHFRRRLVGIICYRARMRSRFGSTTVHQQSNGRRRSTITSLLATTNGSSASKFFQHLRNMSTTKSSLSRDDEDLLEMRNLMDPLRRHSSSLLEEKRFYHTPHVKLIFGHKMLPQRRHSQPAIMKKHSRIIFL